MSTSNAAISVTPVILCGGSGSRLWPVSRENYPKPFVQMENGRTLFMDTLERGAALKNAQRPIVVCNQAHRFYVLEALAHLRQEGRIILEPEGRNTAPAIALAAFSLINESPDSIMLVLPSDHLIADHNAFGDAVFNASLKAAQGKIVTFGIKPDHPDSGFGYIQGGDNIGEGCINVLRFIEKPERARAEAMLAEGNYYWNSGIFLMKAVTFLEELEKFAPEIYTACKSAWEGMKPDMAFTRLDDEAFRSSPANSIDYAIMEHTDHAAMYPLNTNWSDLGSWDAFYEAESRDESGNVLLGDVLAIDSRNCYLHAHDRLLAVIGTDDLAVVETRDAVLVIPREKSQEVKKIVHSLKQKKRKEYKDSVVVFRPWGSYETLVQGPRFQVKKIIVKPGGQLSLQLHHHRAEHWVVVKGTAEVTIGDNTNLLTENQSVYIPVGSRHKLVNPGLIPLEIIEIQAGPYLGEDDIKRFEDIYGRN